MSNSLNGPATGIVLKETVRRAIRTIRNQRFSFEAAEKTTEGKDYDLVTSADNAAQEVYVRALRECFPGYGIVAEESDLHEPCRLGDRKLYFTIDPLDGTKAYARRQSAGVGTQIALVDATDEPAIIAAYVGDVNTQEVYGYRPGSAKVHRISEFEHSEKLNTLLRDQPLVKTKAALRDLPGAHHPLIARLAAPKTQGGLSKDVLIVDGSIGIMHSLLWKGEVGLMVLAAMRETPWDLTPVLGISQKLGFVALKATDQGFEPYQFEISEQIYRRDHDVVWVHGSRLNEVLDWS